MGCFSWEEFGHSDYFSLVFLRHVGPVISAVKIDQQLMNPLENVGEFCFTLHPDEYKDSYHHFQNVC